MATSGRWGGPLVLLQAVSGVYLATLGVSELFAHRSQLNQFARSLSATFQGGGSLFPTLVAVVELAVGALLLWALFLRVSNRAVYISCLAIVPLSLIRVVVPYLFRAPFEPTILSWLTRFAGELLPAFAVWTVGSSYTTD